MEKAKNYERERKQDSQNDSKGRKQEKAPYTKSHEANGSKRRYNAAPNAYGGKPYRNKREKEREQDLPVDMQKPSDERYAEVADVLYPEDDSIDQGLIVGRNAVRELLRSGRPVDKIYVSGREGSITMLVAEAKKRGIPVVDAEMPKLDQLSGGEHHQGIIAQAAAREYASIEDILQIADKRGEMPLIVVCDGVEDPHNLGAIIRCAECCGAHGVIIPKRRACGLTTAVAKASAGAIEHMAVARVQNIAGAIEELKKAGVWTFAAEAGGQDFWENDFRVPCAIVLGSEGNGISRLVKDRSDFLVSIPMYGEVNSLNVSTAASILLCHAARMQRTPK